MQRTAISHDKIMHGIQGAANILQVPTYEQYEPYLSRMMLGGLSWGDIVLALRGLHEDSTFEGWEGWFHRWCRLGFQVEEKAQEAVAQQHHVTFRQLLLKAAACYHFAEFMYFDDPEAKFRARRQVSRLFERAIPYMEHEVQMLSVPYGDLSLPTCFLPAPGNGHAPCVILVNGLDSAKEIELYAIARELLARGISVFLFDGPGQGVLHGLHPMEIGFERVMESILARVLGMELVDASRVGIIGLSYGGYLATRSAAFFPREIKACVNISGGYDHDDFQKMDIMTRKAFCHAFARMSDTSMSRIAREQLNLRAVPGIQAPLLVIHGQMDPIIPYESCIRLLEWARGEKSIIVYPGEQHVATNYFSDLIPRMTDWMAEKLCERPC